MDIKENVKKKVPRPVATEGWRLLMEGEGSPAWNMAVDEALLRQVKEPVLRVYGWSEPAQSIGYFQPASVAVPGLALVRRYTGGGWVEHGRDLTYTLVLPRSHGLLLLSTVESYSCIHEGILDALEQMGLESPCLVSEAQESNSAACFEKAVLFDVKVGSQKIAGAAQRRTRQGLLQQGSILLPDGMDREILVSLLPEVLAQSLGFVPARSCLTEEERELASKLEKTRYGHEDWTYHW